MDSNCPHGIQNTGDSISWEHAQEILGKNFFGPKEWSFFYNVRFDNDLLAQVERFPWSEEILNARCPLTAGKTIKDTHFAFLGLPTLEGVPLTIVRWHEIHGGEDNPRVDKIPRYLDTKHALFLNATTCDLRWYLMPTIGVRMPQPNFWKERKKSLPRAYEVPSAVSSITLQILYFHRHGYYLPGNDDSVMPWLCEDDVPFYANPDSADPLMGSAVANSESYGIYIQASYRMLRFSHLYLAASRRLGA